ncbi:MAG: hypothetical protein HY744_06415 [Deltaproteobacteria bacterium]|nr:hypothetical protein [Deltaproteobacteria bacterium]
MRELVVAAYLSEHGFGHAVRSLELLRALAERRPEIRVHLATRLPAWLHERVPRLVRHERMALPPPLVQADSINVDHEASVKLLGSTLAGWPQALAEHRRFLGAIGARLVYCDVPALPLAAGRAAGVRAVALGNFTWDWIYRAYRDMHPIYGQAAEQHGQAYGAADLYLRLPMAAEPPCGVSVRELGWIARRPAQPRARVRAVLGLGEQEPVVLLSLGGHPSIDLGELAASPLARRVQLLGGRQLAALAGVVHVADEARLRDQGIAYVDLVAAADVVVSKPGYGIISECVAARTRLVYLPRPGFPEIPLLVPDMRRLLGAIEVSADGPAVAGIAAAVERALAQPRPEPDCSLAGNDEAVAAIESLL